MIINDGELPNEISLDDLKTNHLSRPRNPLIADIFYKSGFIESWGQGTLKIIEECKNARMPEPLFESNNNQFSVTFTKTDLKTDLKTDEIIIEIISANKYITIEQIANAINKGTTVTKQHVANLKKTGLLRRIGPAKGGHWEVIK